MLGRHFTMYFTASFITFPLLFTLYQCMYVNFLNLIHGLILLDVYKYMLTLFISWTDTAGNILYNVCMFILWAYTAEYIQIYLYFIMYVCMYYRIVSFTKFSHDNYLCLINSHGWVTAHRYYFPSFFAENQPSR